MNAMLWLTAVLRPVILAFLVCGLGAFIPAEQRSGLVLVGYLVLWLLLMVWAGFQAVSRGASGFAGAAAAGAAVGFILVLFLRGFSRWRQPTPWLPDNWAAVLQPAIVLGGAAIAGLVGGWALITKEASNAA